MYTAVRPAVTTPTAQRAMSRDEPVAPADASTPARIASLLKKPANGGMPAIARVAMTNVACVHGMCRSSPPIFLMSCSPDMAWMTEPAPRNRSALKKACVMR